MIMIPLDLVHFLVQRATERHDEFLETPAHGHQRYPRFQHRARQR